jgi:DNA-binding MarR family transcriptional regulator
MERRGQVEFKDLKHNLGITDGNLSNNIRSLEMKGYVNVHKEIIGAR